MMRHEYRTRHEPRMTPVRFPLDVAHLAAELDAHPEAWNERRMRTEIAGSPHREIDDIWARYNVPERAAIDEPHAAVWYPVVDKLPSVGPLVCELAYRLEAATIGGVLITRVPAGAQVHWHSDRGWHAGAHRKFCVCVRANQEQTFEFEDEQMRSESGDCFEFENAYPHRVLNPSDEPRISLIVCLRDFQ